MVTGPAIAVLLFTSVIASASVVYVAANAGVVLPGLVTVTCALAPIPNNTRAILNSIVDLGKSFSNTKKAGLLACFAPWLAGLI